MSTAPNATWFFSAMTPSGAKTRGLRAAPDRQALAEALKSRDLLLLGAWKLPGGAALSGVAGDTSSPLPLRDEAAINTQLASLLDRGVPLVEALEVAATVVSEASRERVERMRDLVSGGSSFAGACRSVGGFDDVSIAVYRAAERTGDLASAGARLAAAAERRLAIRGKAVTVMIYPLLVLTVAIVILSGLVVFVVPNIAQSVASMGVEIPWFSELVFGFGQRVRDNLGAALVMLVGVLLIFVVLRGALVRGVLAVARRIPAIANLLMATELTRLFSVLGAMTRSGVPLAEALDVSTSSVGDPKLRSQLETLRRQLVEGGVLRTLIERVDALPLATRRLLVAAERGGDLDEAFESLAQRTADEVEQRSARLLALMEPAVILLMFAILAPVILAIAVPLINLRTG
jgi:type II secretory pathway component PulF